MGDSANIRIQCPHCSKGLRVAAKLAGRRVKCPNPACGEPIEVLLPLDDEPVARPAPRSGATGPSPKRWSPAKEAESSAAPPPQVRRARWPWYAGGSAAVCLVAGLVFIFMMSGKDRSPVAAEKGEAQLRVGEQNETNAPVFSQVAASKPAHSAPGTSAAKDQEFKASATPEKPLAQVVVGVENAPVYAEKKREQVAVNLGPGSKVDVLEVLDDMVKIRLRYPIAFSRAADIPRGDALIDLSFRTCWIRRCHLCTAKDLERRKANQLVPKSTLCLGFKDGSGFFMTDGELEVRNGKTGMPEGTALWCVESALGRAFAVNNIEFQCKPNTLYYWQDNKVTELSYYSVEPDGGTVVKASARVDPKAPEHPLKNASVGEWVEYKVTSQGGNDGFGSLTTTIRNTVVKKTEQEVVVETWFVGWTPKIVTKTTFKLTEPFTPLAALGMTSLTIPGKTAYKTIDTGAEKLALAGKTFDTNWTQYEISGKVMLAGVEKDLPNPSRLKVWSSAHVPAGGVVKALDENPQGGANSLEYQTAGKDVPAGADGAKEQKGGKPKLADFAGEWMSTESKGLFDSLSLGVEPNGKGSYAYTVSNNITAGILTIKEGKDGFVLQVTSATKMEGDWEVALTDGGDKLRLAKGKEKLTLAKKKLKGK